MLVSFLCFLFPFFLSCNPLYKRGIVKQKFDVSIVIPNFHSMVQNQFKVQIKSFRTNNARDYFNQILSPYFESQGILHDSSSVNTP